MTSNFYSAIHKNLIENPDKTFIKWPNPGGMIYTLPGTISWKGWHLCAGPSN
ncbi:hypothetical protein [Antarcticibacterium arcticum]|uniref:hypothetical protein n=1 Tax=Antarcticibacterium arcticum TaxID=2585771 RepID=UPI00143CF530|nr:hypothetical protein [Antarcticibacterium arcticum]